jgi:hypothetical protein
MARLLVVECLVDADRHRLWEEAAEIRKGLARLQRALEVAVVALLCDAGKAEPEQAEAFVKEYLRK